MSTVVSTSKHIFLRREYLVFGYVRYCERSLNLTIHDVVRNICLNFYYQDERFDIYGKHITADMEQKTIKMNNKYEEANTAFGSIIIDPSIAMNYEWHFKIKNKVSAAGMDAGGICIGIVDMNDVMSMLKFIVNTHFSGRRNIKHYALKSNGYKVSKQIGFKPFLNEHIGTGDHIIMRLRVSSCLNGVLSFEREMWVGDTVYNLDEKIFQFDLEHAKYSMAISLFQGSSIQLMKYNESDKQIQCKGCEKCLEL
eukprot:141419_1